MNLYAIIPAYNEQKHIADVVSRTAGFIPRSGIVVVDDGSRDDTASLSEKCGVVVLRHIVNLGKGAALKTGCDYAFMVGADAVVVLDSDGQHDPAEIPAFEAALKSSGMVFGCRELNRRMPLVFRLGNWFIGRSIELLFGVRIRDTQCGYRAFTRETYNKIRWSSAGYSVESEMIALVGRHRIKYSQLRIATIYHDMYKGTTALDGLKIVLNMLWWRITK